MNAVSVDNKACLFLETTFRIGDATYDGTQWTELETVLGNDLIDLLTKHFTAIITVLVIALVLIVAQALNQERAVDIALVLALLAAVLGVAAERLGWFGDDADGSARS